MIHFHVDGEPIPQPRHRITASRGFATAYIPASHPVHAWKRAIRKAAREAMDQAGMKMWGKGVPLSLSVMFFMPKAKSNRLEWPTIKPDLDNLEKALLDACNKLVWHDDSQVMHVRKTKMWADITGPALDVLILQVGRQNNFQGEDI